MLNMITTTDLKKQENGLQKYIQGQKSLIYCAYCLPEKEEWFKTEIGNDPAWKQWMNHCHYYHPDKWGDSLKDKKTRRTIQVGMLSNKMSSQWHSDSSNINVVKEKMEFLSKLFGQETIVRFEDLEEAFTFNTIKWKPSDPPIHEKPQRATWMHLVYLCVLAQHDVGVRHVIDIENDKVVWIDAWQQHKLEDPVNGSDMHTRGINACSYIFGYVSDKVVEQLSGKREKTVNKPTRYPYTLIPSTVSKNTTGTTDIKRKWQATNGPTNGCLTPAALALYKEFRKYFKHDKSNEFQGIFKHVDVYDAFKGIHESYTRWGHGDNFNLSKFFEVTVSTQSSVEQTEVVNVTEPVKTDTCLQCKGHGRISMTMTSRPDAPIPVFDVECPHCKGSGVSPVEETVVKEAVVEEPVIVEEPVEEEPQMVTVPEVFMPEEPAYLVDARNSQYDTWVFEAPDQHSVPISTVRQTEPKIETITTTEVTAQKALEILLEKAKRVDQLEKENEQLKVELAGVYANITNIGEDRAAKEITIQELQIRNNELYTQINAYESKRGSTKEFFMANLERFKKSQK